ncbi:hypothetical protein B0J12DRAFT_681644 [Macrophomina phaseolina]|uniref:L27 domain-containing protein n=1 Tax=Macrophomina phaseolina TaxID=35725 RepID=A0ABQ8FW36_9PEZI|nr:hypothetical protein B0J12DRAFT_681644 [Macrophomina phaseolina]
MSLLETHDSVTQSVSMSSDYGESLDRRVNKRKQYPEHNVQRPNHLDSKGLRGNSAVRRCSPWGRVHLPTKRNSWGSCSPDDETSVSLTHLAVHVMLGWRARLADSILAVFMKLIRMLNSPLSNISQTVQEWTSGTSQRAEAHYDLFVLDLKQAKDLPVY